VTLWLTLKNESKSVVILAFTKNYLPRQDSGEPEISNSISVHIVTFLALPGVYEPVQ